MIKIFNPQPSEQLLHALFAWQDKEIKEK